MSQSDTPAKVGSMEGLGPNALTHERAADMLTAYAELIRRDGASRVEEHHYLPEVEHAAAMLREPPPARDQHRGGSSYEASMLRNLLARIHRDGGHYLEKHGLDQALEDADAKVVKWLALGEVVGLAYGHLWMVNNEPGTPRRYPPERAAYEARKLLRDTMTHEQRGEFINRVIAERMKMQTEQPAVVGQVEPTVRRACSEHDRALREANETYAEQAYFDARPQIDTRDRRNVFAHGFTRGWDQAAPLHPGGLTDEAIKTIAEGMPGGLDGFLKGWGWQQFARAIEAAHGIPVNERA